MPYLPNTVSICPGCWAQPCQTTVEYFNNWQGLYVSGFVLALQPGLFGNACTG